MWKEAVLAQLVVTFRNLLEGTEENHDIPQ
jgi:hypothetical protein